MPIKRQLDLALDEGGVVILEGGLITWRMVGNEAWTGPVWVHPNFRGQGLAAQLVKVAAHQAKAKGATHLNSKTMVANRGITMVYDRMGRNMVDMDAEHIYWRDVIDRIAT